MKLAWKKNEISLEQPELASKRGKSDWKLVGFLQH